MISPRLNMRFHPLLMILLALFMLTVQGCGGGGGSGTVTSADPTGYYNVHKFEDTHNNLAAIAAD